VMAKDGWAKDDIKNFCFENTQTPLSELKRINLLPGEIKGEDMFFISANEDMSR